MVAASCIQRSAADITGSLARGGFSSLNPSPRGGSIVVLYFFWRLSYFQAWTLLASAEAERFFPSASSTSSSFVSCDTYRPRMWLHCSAVERILHIRRSRPDSCPSLQGQVLKPLVISERLHGRFPQDTEQRRGKRGKRGLVHELWRCRAPLTWMFCVSLDYFFFVTLKRRVLWYKRL